MAETFSHFRLTTYETCPQQYHFRYIAKKRINLLGIEAFMGKQVHEVLQHIYRNVADGVVPRLDEALSLYRRNWQDRLDMDRIRIAASGRGADSYQANGARCIENYYRRHHPFDADETLRLEMRIRFKLDENGDYKMGGVIDRLARAQDGALEIHDFKTGARYSSEIAAKAERQLRLYALGVRQNIKDADEVRLVLHYVFQDRRHVLCPTEEQLADLRRQTAALIDRVRSENEWPPQPGPLCDWCEYQDGCPAFRTELLKLL